MRRVTHLVVGITIGLIVSYYYGRAADYLYPALGGFFGILPDFDIFLAKAGIARHRGAYSHSFLSSLVLAVIAGAVLFFGYGWLFGNILPVSAVIFLATFAHTATDSMTKGGTKLFYPFSGVKIHGRIDYDDWLYNGLLVLLCLVAIAYLAKEALMRLL
jgi:membrane-bound metal-dependent hydrolase YbcI (DUF457 family)